MHASFCYLSNLTHIYHIKINLFNFSAKNANGGNGSMRCDFCWFFFLRYPFLALYSPDFSKRISIVGRIVGNVSLLWKCWRMGAQLSRLGALFSRVRWRGGHVAHIESAEETVFFRTKQTWYVYKFQLYLGFSYTLWCTVFNVAKCS